MTHYDHQQAPPQVYPPPAYDTAPPPPAGYPVNSAPPADQVPIETKSRGDGFWKGCAAALCCCCVLEACF